ncbi:hypothetical protein ABL78_7965 [Leptomonas seymouri]|uniref:LSM domain-containing protein n=1 Tax=Leptomonas seymouri TaxID=5684 RepID=A0A0N1HTA2_LEPSE|nr:hypothetical protein ABL78_7965 [Leptomonas seymouri]|eukprot:KPI83018.1 hypothetical protein ABL78_7965 [Leptomonas seymouri]
MEEGKTDATCPVASSSTVAAAAAAPTDPFQFLARHIQRRVAVTLLPLDPVNAQDGGVVVSGTLLSVDDLCNVFLRNWTCANSVTVSAIETAGPLQPRKKTRTEASGEGGESLRLIRGAQIASIALLDFGE